MKYPELAIPLAASDDDYPALFERLFPESKKEELSDQLAAFEKMLLDEELWNEQQAREFLVKNEQRLNELVEGINPQHSHREVEFTELSAALHLLAMSYGLEAKLGDSNRAIVLHDATRDLIRASLETDLLHSSVALASGLMKDQYSLDFCADLPQIVMSIAETPWSPPSFSRLLKGEFVGGMQMAYSFAEETEQGQIVLGGDMATPPDIPPFTVDMVEDVVARVIVKELEFLRQQEQSEDYVSGEEMTKKLESFVSEGSFSEFERAIAETFLVGFGYYYDNWREVQLLRQTNHVALCIALAQSQGGEFTGELPVDFKTGESIIWDKENNALRADLGENGPKEIQIPVIK